MQSKVRDAGLSSGSHYVIVVDKNPLNQNLLISLATEHHILNCSIASEFFNQ
jgi:hypothetical protein